MDEKKPEEKPKEPDKEPEKEKPVSIVDEARGIRDEIVKARDSLKEENDRKEKLQADEMLGGSAGGRVEPKQVSPQDEKTANAIEFWKGTQLEQDIIEANA